MIVALDFDGTLVRQDRQYADVTTPLEFLPGAKDGVLALKAAGHVLILWSGRASRALTIDPNLDPLVRAGVRKVDLVRWMASQDLNLARLAQMISFVNEQLPGVFAAIDDGAAGKLQADMFVDDRGLRFGFGPGGVSWREISFLFGEPSGTPQQQEGT